MTVWIGIDPGKDTGIVVRDRDRLLWWDVIEGDEPAENEVLSERTLDAVKAGVRAAIAAADDYSAIHDIGGPARLAAEGVVRPNSHHEGEKSFVDPFAVAIPAVALGAVRGAFRVDVIVPPNKHGSNWLVTYPPELVTAAERRHGLNRPGGKSSTVRHARSAWDVAGAATAVRRIELARAGAR